MTRMLLFWAVGGLLALAAGCTMCAHPYDYCGPVYQGGSAPPCDPCCRGGSILAPCGGGVAAHGAEAPQPAPPGEMVPAPAPMNNPPPSSQTQRGMSTQRYVQRPTYAQPTRAQPSYAQ